jgi:hypothetical protein
LLRLAALDVEVDDPPVRELRIGHDEARPEEEFSGLLLDLCRY